MENNYLEDNYKVLTFHLGSRLYTVSVPQLLEVIRPVKLFPVDKSKAYILGMMNYHGTAVPVLALRRLLDGDRETPDSEQVWLAVAAGKVTLCLGVDRLGRFCRVTRENIDDVPLLVKNRETDYIRQYVKLEDELVPIIDAPKLLAHKKAEIEALISAADMPSQGDCHL